MENVEFLDFLRTTLIKVENTINLIEQDNPRHIPAYNKMLGVQQKIAGLASNRKAIMFSQLIAVRAIINYFMNGRYDQAHNSVLKLRESLNKIYLQVEKNERDKNK